MIVAFYSQGSGTGKDSCADFAADWCRERGIAHERDAFAWDGKVVCADALGFEGTRMEKVAWVDRLKLHGEVFAPIQVLGAVTFDGVPVRMHPIRQVGGREFIIGLLGSPDKGNGIRGLDEKFWTRQVIERDARRPWDSITLISDLRFLEEAESVYAAYGAIVEVVRPDAPCFNEQRVPDGQIRHTISNDGGLDELRAQVEHHMERIAESG